MDQANGKKEIPLNELLNSPCNIGRVFNLDTITLLDILYRLEKTGTIKINRTAGLDVINLLTGYTFQECVESYYKNISELDWEIK